MFTLIVFLCLQGSPNCPPPPTTTANTIRVANLSQDVCNQRVANLKLKHEEATCVREK